MKLRSITASQKGKCLREGCQIYALQVGYTNLEEKTITLENIPIVQTLPNVFLEEIHELPIKRDIEFTIELIPRAYLVSKAPYRMSIPELTELNMHLQELLDKKYICPSVSPWGARVIFVKKKYGTLRLYIDY